MFWTYRKSSFSSNAATRLTHESVRKASKLCMRKTANQKIRIKWHFRADEVCGSIHLRYMRVCKWHTKCRIWKCRECKHVERSNVEKKWVFAPSIELTQNRTYVHISMWLPRNLIARTGIACHSHPGWKRNILDPSIQMCKLWCIYIHHHTDVTASGPCGHCKVHSY